MLLAEAEEDTEIIRATVPPPIGQQVFTIGSGLAGGLAGFILAQRLIGKERVDVAPLIAATILSATATLGAAFLIRSR
jgi:hypothetical protein